MANTFYQQYSIVNQYGDSDSVSDVEFLRMGDSYGKYITYSIECWGDGDWAYGYYNVCDHSKNSGTYLLDTDSFQSLKLNKGLPLSINGFFQNNDELIIYGTLSEGKTGVITATYVLKMEYQHKFTKRGFEIF